MAFKRVFLKNLFVSGGFTYLTQSVVFLASFITSRLLSPQDYGLIGLITVFSGFISIFSDSGISLAVIRSPYRETYYRGLNMLAILIGVTLCLITIAVMYPVSLFYKKTDIIRPGIAISFLFIIKSFSVVPMAVLQRRFQFSLAGKILFVSTIAGTIATIIMAYAGLTYWSLIWSQYVSSLISFVILYRVLPNVFKKTRKTVLIKTLLLARMLIGSLIGFNVINYWARNTDNLVVGKYYSTSDLGIYNRAYMMLQLPLTLITGIFSSVLLPSLVKHKEEGGNVEEEYYFILKIISLLNLPVAIILLLFPEGFVKILWGENWIVVAKLLPYFGLLVMTQTLLSTLGNLMVVEQKERALMYAGWVGSVCLVAGIIFGAVISLTAIAAFYALAFIVLVLPFNIIYLMRNKLKFVTCIASFWVPKFILSLVLWIAIYNSFFLLLISVICLWTALVIWDARFELIRLRKLVFARINF